MRYFPPAIAFAGTFGWSRYSISRDASIAAGGNGPIHARLQNSGSSWTSDDDATLRTLVNAGVPLKSVAARMERTVPAIRSRMAKLGLRFPES